MTQKPEKTTGSRDKTPDTKTGNGNRLADAVTTALMEKKAKDIVVLDVRGLTTLTDYFVVCHGTSDTQIKALADHVHEYVAEKTGEKAWKKEGLEARRWVILDYVNLVVHIFNQEKREYYGIERMWNDAIRTDIRDEPVQQEKSKE
ncbi:MAG: ribosome silencing factor [Balneolaceae bacterium]